MGYLYEHSNPERFQQFCQSLLLADFPKLQCFPVGQPDGGRDGWDPESKTVLQVKFKRADEKENADWLIAALELELPKIRRLAERGAESYIIATNAHGTAHEEVGRIDRVQRWLDDNLPIPGTCFWRDELDRRLDSAMVPLKLKYSELLSLEDGFEVVLSAVFGSSQERQQDAVRAFVAAQFESDKDVKFKQVNLSNDLLDLFVDVPAKLPPKLFNGSVHGSVGDGLKAFFSALAGPLGVFYVEEEGYEVFVESDTGPLQRLDLGAAEILLSSAAQEHLKLVVLEGAPGQGKSTLAQYVCQVHRARYLQRRDVLDRIPEAHKQTGFRIPLKVDLRDYAAFLEGSSPFASATSPSEPRTLDVFLSQLICYFAGGTEFTPHDVLSLLKNAPTLLFLDGLDEVADISARETLVASIGEALARWRVFDVDLQVVVTSRPSVFGRAPSVGKFGFMTLTLQNINLERIDDYAERWVMARGLDDSERRDVKKILAEKLELAHIRDLTRNPMQLTILLTLIHQIGHSLPDQRTDLYRHYIELFLAREADKSVRVRENRAVLLGFIQHLAWILQTQAEASKSAGSISAQGLQSLAREYLGARGHAIEIADDLFGGGLERIFVLVERIEGLYEFEVQPLREFFCARHLYSTAPVGTYRGNDLCGDRAQRFEALAANPFWLNVCRFYAGSCERGEMGTLVVSLMEMIRSSDLAVAGHARRVGLALLQDWVFSNVKYTQDLLIRAIFDDAGTQLLICGEGRLIDELVLEVECGRQTLRDCVFDQLKKWPFDVRTSALCRVLRMNGAHDLAQEFCGLLSGQMGRDRTYQLIRMFRAGASASLDPAQVWELVTEDDPGRDQLLVRSSQLLMSEPKVAVRIPQLVDEFARGVLDGLVVHFGQYRSALDVFAELLGSWPGAYMGLRRLGEPAALDEAPPGSSDTSAALDAVRAFVDAVGAIHVDGADVTLDQRLSPELWSSVAEIAREQFGDTWSTMSMAIRMAGAKTAAEMPGGSDRLFDPGAAICARARAARLRRGGTMWWLEQLKQASTSPERALWAGLVLMWSSAKNLYALSTETSAIVDSLGDLEYVALRSTLSSAASSCVLRADRRKLAEVDLRPFSDRTAVLVAVATRAASSKLVYSTEQGAAEPLCGFLKNLQDLESLDQLPSWKHSSEAALAWARRQLQLRGVVRGSGYRVHRHLRAASLETQSAEKVLVEPRLYPPELVLCALTEVQRSYRPMTLEAIENEQGWTFD